MSFNLIFHTIGNCLNRPCRFALIQTSYDRRATSGERTDCKQSLPTFLSNKIAGFYKKDILIPIISLFYHKILKVSSNL